MSEPLPTNYQPELRQRHRTTVLIVRVLLALTVGLSLAAFLVRNRFQQQDNPALETGLKVAIFLFGVGSIVLRRTRFATMSLQNITALEGVPGLLATLQKTTIQVALLGGTVAVFGFIATILTGNAFYTYGAGVVALFVLLNCYPTLIAWQKTASQYGDALQNVR